MGGAGVLTGGRGTSGWVWDGGWAAGGESVRGGCRRRAAGVWVAGGGRPTALTAPSLGRTPPTHGRFLAAELRSRDAGAEPSVLGPGALGVTETQPGPRTSGGRRNRPPARRPPVWRPWRPGPCAVN